MASSKVMTSASSSATANPDLTRDSSSLHSLQIQPDRFQSGGGGGCGGRAASGSMNMDDLLKNIYADSDSFPPPSSSSVLDGAPSGSKSVATKTVDEVWKEIVAGTGGGTSREPEMTLEDFLTKAGAVREEEVRVPVMQPPTGFGVESMMNATQFAHMQASPGAFGVDSMGYGNGFDGRMVPIGGGAAAAAGGSSVSAGVGRGKRRAVEVPLDKATQQKQKRMIKNRESAARSRERKQAYTVELESLVTKLEEENARLLSEEVVQSKERLKQLMENLIPVVEKRRPPRTLRRVHSMSW